MIKIVLIDTGLTDDYNDSRITGGCSVIEKDSAFEIAPGYSDHIGHGTAAVDIILKHSLNAGIYIIGIYEEDLFINEEKLCFALNYARKNLEYDMIQISSGLLTYSRKLHDLVKHIVCEDRKFIISAFDNEGGMSYPAAFPEVMGIDVNPLYRKKEDYDIVEDNVVDLRGGDVFFRVPWINKGKNIVKGTSFLTSYFSAWIADHCEGDMNKVHICEVLKENAKCIYPDYTEGNVITSEEFVKNIKHAIAFPFNKEIYCLAAFEDLLPFKIDGYYDIRHKFLVGKKINEVLKYTENDSVIKNVDNIDWNGEFDTIICGHLSEISSVTGIDYLMNILQLCSAHNKKAYVFDDMGLLYENYKNTNTLFSPIISVDRNLNNHFGKLRICNTPVLAVLGTSSRQGKYTIQLSLLKEFKKRGLKVDGISTEPTGALFGFSEMFACGYGSNNTLSAYEMIRVLNDMVYKLETNGNDLIITGGQSSSIAYDTRNESLIPIEQYSFITGVSPDGVILCINEIDELSYVKRTISFIEAISCAKVFVIIISPVHNSQTDPVYEGDIAEMLRLEYGDQKSIYYLQDIDIKALADEVVQYYE